MSDASPAAARADTYRLLARLCLAEVDARLLAALRQTAEFGPSLVGEDEALLAALRAEYARLFLLNAVPYESVYVDEQMMLNTAATALVVAAYREGGYSPAGQVGAPDHVGLELAFVGHLAAVEAAVLSGGDTDGLARQRTLQRRFLTDHLGRWAPIWATAVQRLARHAFYAALAEVARDYVLAELEAALSARE
jgi:putative dimethyl sulfoxide reductase chaperone